MKTQTDHTSWRDWLLLLLFLGAATGAAFLLSRTGTGSSAFATPVYILAVALISLLTTGYACGIVGAVVGVFCVNTLFTYPFWEFNLTISGYPLTFAVMLLVSIIISTLTTRLKRQELLRFEAEKEQMRANLLRAVSHDIRTPLASILGASSTLLESSLSTDDREELLEEIHKDAQWLIRVTENLLSVTKFSDGVQVKKTDEVAEEIVASAIVKFRKSQSIPILVEKPEEILLAPMDAMLIEQVLINLLENVVMHAQIATCIRIAIRHEPGRAVFLVEDDGVGISPALLPHIFDGYSSTLEQSTADGRRNMGIGLSVCKSILRAHGGELSAENNAMGGASFQFWLPLEEGEYER